MDMNLDKICKEVVTICKEVGIFIMNEFNGFDKQNIEYKNPNDPVSYVDKIAEEKYVEKLKLLLPEAGFICEEGHGSKNKIGYNWIIDPIDGTTNYVHGIPFFCSSIALAINNEILVGVVADFVHNTFYTAIKNGNAYCNERKLILPEQKISGKAVIATSLPDAYHPQLTEAINFITDVLPKVHGWRRLGAAALELAMVADGKLDAFFESGLKPWDVAAGSLIVQTSGGIVTDYLGKPDFIYGKKVLAASKNIHTEIQPLLAERLAIFS